MPEMYFSSIFGSNFYPFLFYCCIKDYEMSTNHIVCDKGQLVINVAWPVLIATKMSMHRKES